MRQTALAVVLVLVAVSVSLADGPAAPTASVRALGQPLPRRVGNGDCTMSEEAQALLGNTPPPGAEIEPRSSEGHICEIELPICYYYEGEGDCYDDYVDDFKWSPLGQFLAYREGMDGIYSLQFFWTSFFACPSSPKISVS